MIAVALKSRRILNWRDEKPRNLFTLTTACHLFRTGIYASSIKNQLCVENGCSNRRYGRTDMPGRN